MNDTLEFYIIVEIVASKTSLRTSVRSNTLLAGFPVKSLSEWQHVLLDAGFKLAICNQTDKR